MPDDRDERIDSIMRDLSYYRSAVKSAGVGVQPPTVHAIKYVEDVEYLLSKLENRTPKTEERPQLEIDLAHDATVRTERRG